MYRKILHNAFSLFKPNVYLEIGVCNGDSLSFFEKFKDKTIIGIDPDMSHYRPKQTENFRLYEMTSDDFFKNKEITKNLKIDMAFIDGMHRFEYALRDFINCERHSNNDSVIFFHDVNPVDIRATSRDMILYRGSWNGDVWKINNILKEYRPDLDVTLFNIVQGVLMVKNLDNTSTILSDNYDDIVKKYIDFDFSNMYTGNSVQYYS